MPNTRQLLYIRFLLMDWDLISSYFGLLTLATGTIYAGAFTSLPNPPKKDGEPHDEDDSEEDLERLSSSDAWLFPVVGTPHLQDTCEGI